MIGIYKITSFSDKIYIGQSINIDKRFYDYRKLINCKSQIKLYHSFLKYGVDNHKFEIIEECSIELLNERERYWQDFYDCLDKGLNCRLTNTNDKSGKLSNETKLKLSKSCLKLRKEGRGNPPPKPMPGNKNPMFNKRHSLETIQKMIKNRKKRAGENHPNHKIYLNLETGCFYFSIGEVAQSINKNWSYVADRLFGRIKQKLNIIKV